MGNNMFYYEATELYPVFAVILQMKKNYWWLIYKKNDDVLSAENSTSSIACVFCQHIHIVRSPSTHMLISD